MLQKIMFREKTILYAIKYLNISFRKILKLRKRIFKIFEIIFISLIISLQYLLEIMIDFASKRSFNSLTCD